MPRSRSMSPRITEDGSLPRIVAHRGLHREEAGGARKNTLASVLDAVTAGATYVEIDVRVTGDGAIVLLHDPDLRRLWGDPLTISEATLADVRELGGGPRRIPLLSEVLDAVNGTGVTLLIDMDEPAPALGATEVVRACGAEDHVAWCGNLEGMRIVREALPDATVWLPWSSAKPPEPEDLAALRPAVVNACHLLVGREFVEQVHELGADVSVWTVNAPDQAVHLARIGVDSITTDTPEAILRAVQSGAEPNQAARRLGVVQEIAATAAEMTIAARAHGVGSIATKKDAADHVTEVDRSIERTVREVLHAQFPEADVVGEEYGGAAPGGRDCWYVDPVDGTANLANGVPWTSFSLALVADGRPVVAAVLDPVGTVPVVAAEGAGVWRGGEPLPPIPRPELAEGSSVLTGAMVMTELAGADPWPHFHTFLDLLAAERCTLRVQGSGTATLAGVALGRGSAAMVHRYGPIDHAAALLVVAEAGGTVLDTTGEPTLDPVEGPVFVGRDHAAARALYDVWKAAAA